MRFFRMALVPVALCTIAEARDLRAGAKERDVTCRGKLVDTSESSFRVGKCEFVRETHVAVLDSCSRYSKEGRFLANLNCVVKARINDLNRVTHVYSARAQ
jgi:hypothetical protein